MQDVKIVDIDNEQWNIKDQEARNRIAILEEKQSQIIDVTFSGTTTFFAKMKYLGEDSNYIYYNFWWEGQSKTLSGNINPFLVLPPNTSTDKILNLNLNMLQAGNIDIIQKTQHLSGINNSGMVTYIGNLSTITNWTISGMGILKRSK